MGFESLEMTYQTIPRGIRAIEDESVWRSQVDCYSDSGVERNKLTDLLERDNGQLFEIKY